MNLRAGYLALVGLASFPVAATNSISGCKGGTVPLPTPQQIEAGTQVEQGVCSLIEGIDQNGAIKNICATIDEIAQMVAFITNFLRPALQDAGVPLSQQGTCTVLPSSTLCATSLEKAKAIDYIVKVRVARLMLDAGK